MHGGARHDTLSVSLQWAKGRMQGPYALSGIDR